LGLNYRAQALGHQFLVSLSNHSGWEANWQKEINFSSVLILVELLSMLIIDLSVMRAEM